MQVIGRTARMARHHKRHESAEINLTSMIDFLTILVFFLLVHGGFVRLAILELNLPTSNSTPTEEPPQFQLELSDVAPDVAARQVHVDVTGEHAVFVPDHRRSGDELDVGQLGQRDLRPRHRRHQDLADLENLQ